LIRSRHLMSRWQHQCSTVMEGQYDKINACRSIRALAYWQGPLVDGAWRVERQLKRVHLSLTALWNLWHPITNCRLVALSFLHCPREANKVAHNLARLSYNSDSIFLWDGDPPPSVFSDVIDDVWFKAASFRRTLFLTRVPKGTGRFLMRRLACLIYYGLPFKKKGL
jgi:hypothetical protein